MHRDRRVRELLSYVARLRLADLSSAETRAAGDDVIASVDLSQHAGKLVRQLSGGLRSG
jgi:ABC-type multidrug transport system ATPase subunit